MDIERARNHLLPGRENEPKYRDYLRRLSLAGLRTLGVVEIAAAMLLHFGRMAAHTARWPQTLLIVGVGLLTLGLARGKAPRLRASISVWLAAALLMLPGESPGSDDYTIAAITLLLITGIASIPFLPWQALAQGLAIEMTFIASAVWTGAASTHTDAHHIFLILLALLATGIAASNYQHRHAEFDAQEQAVRVAEALTGAQMRAQLAENAISIGKMAAALSHEINSPVGALRSSIGTLLALTDRMLDQPDQRERLAPARAELQRSIAESAARIDEVTRRLKRFVSLEEAEIKSADVNDLLTDVTLLFQDQIRDAKVELQFDLEKPLPALTCRPQLLTAAFSTLLSNAIQAVNGDGRIGIETRGKDGEVEITIRDNGRGMSPEEADTIFDPSFKVAEGRISSGNWSLFNSRQIVYEHGGEIRLETAPGRGTAMHVTLPVA